MKIVSIVPIKMNNERLPGKNTKLLGGIPLIGYVQKSLMEADNIDQRYVYCSCEEIKRFLLPGITYLNRDAKLDLPTSNFSQIFESFCNIVDADIYVYAHATAPFITAETINECIASVRTGKHDSAFCALKIQDYLWQDGKPLNFDAANVPRSQDLQPIYRETSGVYVFRKEIFARLHRRIGKNPYIKEVDYKQAIDINTPEDFKLAEIMVNINL